MCRSAFAFCSVFFAMVCVAVAAQAATISGAVTMTAGSPADLSRTVVYLESHPALAGDPPPGDQRPEIVQRDKAFIPDLLVVLAGTTVEFPNWDPYSHNVFSRSRAAQFDLDRYGQGQSKSYTFNNTGVVQIFCNIHPQMRAVLVVLPNRFFVRADARGSFAIPNVPPGQYVLVAWNERTGERRQTIDVAAGDVRGVTIALAGAAAAVQERPSQPSLRPATRGVERGLGVKRERLGLPVVGGAHPATRNGGR
jgi:plastocyanin